MTRNRNPQHVALDWPLIERLFRDLAEPLDRTDYDDDGAWCGGPGRMEGEDVLTAYVHAIAMNGCDPTTVDGEIRQAFGNLVPDDATELYAVTSDYGFLSVSTTEPEPDDCDEDCDECDAEDESDDE